MDGPVFDAMLKNALEEALRLDAEAAPAAPPPSWRQRRRMRRLLAGGGEAGTGRRIPARWAAAAIIAALLTGVGAAGLALGSGEWFRQMFEGSYWSEKYGGAANTQQLLDMGAKTSSAPVEAGGLRFEMLDAVFDGQTVMASLRMTVLDSGLLERLEASDGTLLLMSAAVCSEEGEELESSRCDLRSWKTPEELLPGQELEEGQYALLLSASGDSLSAGGRYSLRLGDLTLFPKNFGFGDVLGTGPWTLPLILRPTEVIHLEPNRACRVNGVDWVLEELTLSPLTLRMSLRCLAEDERAAQWMPYRDLEINMVTGEIVSRVGLSGRSARGSRQVSVRMDFPMPLDLDQVDHIHVCGEDIYLNEGLFT